MCTYITKSIGKKINVFMYIPAYIIFMYMYKFMARDFISSFTKEL